MKLEAFITTPITGIVGSITPAGTRHVDRGIAHLSWSRGDGVRGEWWTSSMDEDDV